MAGDSDWWDCAYGEFIEAPPYYQKMTIEWSINYTRWIELYYAFGDYNPLVVGLSEPADNTLPGFSLTRSGSGSVVLTRTAQIGVESTFSSYDKNTFRAITYLRNATGGGKYGFCASLQVPYFLTDFTAPITASAGGLVHTSNLSAATQVLLQAKVASATGTGSYYFNLPLSTGDGSDAVSAMTLGQFATQYPGLAKGAFYGSGLVGNGHTGTVIDFTDYPLNHWRNFLGTYSYTITDTVNGVGEVSSGTYSVTLS